MTGTAYHTYCLNPPVSEIPKKYFFCPRHSKKGEYQFIGEHALASYAGQLRTLSHLTYVFVL